MLGRTASRIPFYDKKFGLGRFAGLAIGQFAGERQSFQRPLAQDAVLGRLRRLARFQGEHHFIDDRPRVIRSFFQISRQAFAKNCLYRATHFHIAKLGFGLTFKLGIFQFNRDDRQNSLAHIVAGQITVAVFEQIIFPRVIIQGARQGGAEAGQVHAAFRRRSVVSEAGFARGDVIQILESDFYLHAIGIFVQIEDGFVKRLFFLGVKTDV